MKTFYLPLAVLVTAMFVWAPFMILGAPYESTMGLVQKIFYFHAPIGMAMFTSAFVCGIASAIYLFTRRRRADHFALVERRADGRSSGSSCCSPGRCGRARRGACGGSGTRG